MDGKVEYTIKDAYAAINPPSFQFTLAGAKPVRGKKYMSYPSWFELNQSRVDSDKIYCIRNGSDGKSDYRIIVNLVGRTINDSGLAVRRGDTFTLEVYNITEKESINIAAILFKNIKYDARNIQFNDTKEGIDVLNFVCSRLPERMNK